MPNRDMTVLDATQPTDRGGLATELATARFVAVIDRSAEYGTPDAAGPPTVCVVPGLGVNDIAYRDTSGHLHELWRDAQGRTGTTDVTKIAVGGAPTAIGTPYFYVDTTRNTLRLLYRDGNGTVRSLDWSTGSVNPDNLAPNAAGDPVGYYVAPPADTHHVIYRTGDGHLHELNWVGVAPVNPVANLHAADLCASCRRRSNSVFRWIAQFRRIP